MVLRSPADKVIDRDRLLARWRRPRSRRVVFTNGCFDLLHPGHVLYLHEARALGDMLVVGVNTDASVARLKGPGRPLVDQRSRALVLAGLEAVDVVTLFHEDTPADLIRGLLPDVLVKGGDYAPEDVVGRHDVEEAGGEIRIIPFIQGHSTTGLVERIRSRSPGPASPGASPSDSDLQAEEP